MHCEPAAAPLRLRIWSDYLCPWCHLASARLRRLEDELGGRVELEWRSFLLRPSERPRTPERLELFRAYTRSWERPAAEPDAPGFRPWQGDEGPPTHSVPAHLAAKAAARVSAEAFGRLHGRLLEAYFLESRDISDDAVLAGLWRELELPAPAFERRRDPELLEEVMQDHRAALDAGATGVPAVQLVGNDAVIVGAHPEELYRRWVLRTLASGPEARA